MTQAGKSTQHDLAVLFQAGAAIGLTDGEILRRAGRTVDEEAVAFFQAIVDRHGAMVLRTCRGVLGDGSDVDDAFQATFLVLARRLNDARRLESIGGWLHGVALRVANRARADAARRRNRERESGRLAVVVPDAGPSDPDRDRVVQDEVGRLPSRYREVVVLCFWEGLTQEQAADRIGCPIGTVRSRSARARELLRRRLSRRGLAPDGWTTPALIPAPPMALARVTSLAMTETAMGRAASGLVNAQVFELSRLVARSMTMTKLAPLAAAVTFALAAAVGFGRAAVQDADSQSTPPPPAAAVPTRASEPEEYVVEPPDLILVEVLEALESRPISGKRLVGPDGKISLGFYGEVSVAGLTISEVKEKIVLHLRKYLSDELLGLVGEDPASGEPIPIQPRDSDRVFVEVTDYNSKNYYVLGEVGAPGKLPITGNDTVLDAVLYAGGLTAGADASKLILSREIAGEPGGKRTWTIDLDRIIYGDDPSMNHRLHSGDRLIALPKDRTLDTESPEPKAEVPLNAEAEPTLTDLARRLDRIEALLEDLTASRGR